MYDKLARLILKHEGFKPKPYKDTVGKLTIGIGRNLDDVGLTEKEAFYLLESDIERILKAAYKEFPWFSTLSPSRQDVIVSMIFNLGLEGFKGFQKMILALRVSNFVNAAKEMLDSKWATQVPSRAKELSNMMIEG